MIIACPACSTRYVVPDSAIGIDGRTVRCAKCRHSWFQHGPELELVAAQEAPPPPIAPVAPAVPEPAPEPAPGPEVAAMPAPEPEPAPDAVPPPPFADRDDPPFADEPLPEPAYGSEDTADDEYERSNFEAEPPFRPRRNMAKMWTLAAVVFALMATGVVGAVSWFGVPDWVPISRSTFAEGQPGLVLDFPPKRQERRTLPGGAEFFGASGTVTNAGSSRRTVPSILIVLRDDSERIVYSWEVVSPKRQLAPGESVTINEARTDVPKSAKFAEIGWKPG